MFTDTVGFTSSTQNDEARTLELLQQQQALIRPILTAHGGREIKSTGDGFLVEFDSALKATQSAIEIQRKIRDRNTESGGVPIQVRIGIHLGDVEQRGADILGDTVNIAARIEPTAEPGGVCVSGAVREQVWNKIPETLERLPPTALKGVQIPMEVYRIVSPSIVTKATSDAPGLKRMAVLPLANISPDPKDEYFADGLTEELIGALSKIRELRVIARTSVNQYRSTSKTISQIGSELGVRSVLEGSVRKSGDRLRITLQLIDSVTQEHIWAESYDRRLDDVFAIQTEIARQVTEALRVELRPAEKANLGSRPTVRPDSYLAYLKGRTFTQSIAKASLESAKEQFELAISLDHQNAAAHSGLADVLRSLEYWYPSSARAERERAGLRLVERSIELDPDLAEAHASLGVSLRAEFNYPAAEREFKLALSLNPSYSLAHIWYAYLLADQGQIEDALREMTLAEGADPLSAIQLQTFEALLIWQGKLEEAYSKVQTLAGLEQRPDRLYYVALFEYYRAQSDIAGCLHEIQQYDELDVDPRIKACLRAYYFSLAGEGNKARELLDQELQHPPLPLTAWVVPLVYAELGDLDACFRWLERAVLEERLGMSHNYTFVGIGRWRFDPRLGHVRSDPRFAALLKKMNLA
jgi:adenylate cyclase